MVAQLPRTTSKRTTRFRCSHCGNRLVMQNRHLRRLVACHACGRATHPAGKVLAQAVGSRAIGFAPAKVPTAKALAAPSRSCANCGETIGKLQLPHDWRGQAVCHACNVKLTRESLPAKVGPASRGPARHGQPTVRPATFPSGFELSAGPLMPLLLVGATGAAFFVAVSFMSYLGGFVSALVLVAATAAGLRWIRLGTMSIRSRLDQIESVRVRHGNLRVATMLLAWIWSQPLPRKPWALVLVMFWAAVYAPYCISGMLLPGPRPRPPAVVVSARAA
jgi:ribosomal protein S27E